MEYRKTITLKDGRNCIIRNGLAQDGNAARDVFLRTHGETDYLLTYPDETRMTGEQEAQFLKERTESLDEVELVAEIDGCLVGTAGIRCLGRMDKIRHRAEFGIGILRDYWGSASAGRSRNPASNARGLPVTPSWNWTWSQRTPLPSPSTKASVLRSTAAIPAASVPAGAAGRNWSSCAWNWTPEGTVPQFLNRVKKLFYKDEKRL